MVMRPNGKDEGHSIPTARWPGYVLLALIVLLYILLIGRYNAYDVDSRWFPSFSHAFFVEHIQTDPFMQSHFPNGMGGVIAFGKLAAIIQGGILSLVGWSLTAATSVSVAFILASLVLLAATSRHLGYSTNFTICYVALMGFTEPFVAAAQRARYEFLPVFLLCLALYLAARNKIALAMFIAALAFEVEPAAIVVGMGIATFLLVSNSRQSRPLPTPRLVLRLLLGTTAAVGIYFLLHPHIISIFQQAHWADADQGHLPVPGGFVAAYYYVYARHIPELAVILVAIAICILKSKRYLFLDWPALCTAVILVLATILRWPNAVYFAFIAPFLGFFVMQVFYTDRRRNWIIAAILLFTLTQYVHRYRLWSLHNPGFSQYDEDQASTAIVRAASTIGKSPEQLNILGDYALWPAHPHLFVNLNKKTISPRTLQQADLILCLDRPFKPTAQTTQEVLCGDLNPAVYKQTGQMTLNHRQVRLLIPTR
jgi:hypothetical protein